MIDTEKATAALTEYIDRIDQYDALWTTVRQQSGYPLGLPQVRELNDWLDARTPLIEEIAAEVEPNGVHNFAASSFSMFGNARDVAVRTKGILDHEEERQVMFGPAGPKLSAARLHPWVWDPAAPRWDAGQRRDAIQAAATSLFDNHLATKLGRGPDARGGSDLAGQAFSLKEPAAGSPRLRLSGFETGSKDWTNAHQGAMYLGHACAQFIRNLATHRLAEPSEDHALEMLATLSLFARLVSEAGIVTAP